MFSDPQTVTINAIANSLPRTGSGDDEGTFRKDDSTVSLEVAHRYGKRTQRRIRINHKKIAADPLVTAQNLQYSMSMTITVDVPPVGYSPAEVKQVWDGFLANLSADTGANTVKFLGGES